ncbi:MAG TPA: hypothetical protein P5186_13560 [Candidatus Paceibacterota bacterium]|nr:hypothetical protein [Verrucomicrobiota bacterium]HRY49069.1 hypothetical protein [Candidatus Paceibacterota bacterium]
MADVSFYPPRAPRVRFFRELWYRLRRLIKAEKVEAGYYRIQPSVLAFLVPGYGFLAARRRFYAGAIVLGWLTLALVFLIRMGYPEGNVAMGLMISLHASSAVFLFVRTSCAEDLSQRLGIALLVLGGLMVFLYLPLIYLVLPRFLIPLDYEGKVVIVRVGGNPAQVRRGEWVAYRTLGTYNYGGIRVFEGHGLEQVLALPGDTIHFHKTHFEVGQASYPRRPYMPEQGEWQVEPDCWIIWPRLERRANYAPNMDGTIGVVWRDLAHVPRGNFIGRPMKHWFWRKQQLL